MTTHETPETDREGYGGVGLPGHSRGCAGYKVTAHQYVTSEGYVGWTDPQTIPCRGCAEPERHTFTDAELAARDAAVAAQARTEAWDEGVDAAFRGVVTRQNANDVKRRNPYREESDQRTHGLNHAPLPDGVLLDPGFCADCDALRVVVSPPTEEP